MNGRSRELLLCSLTPGILLAVMFVNAEQTSQGRAGDGTGASPTEAPEPARGQDRGQDRETPTDRPGVASEREAVPEDAIRVTTVEELVAARQRVLATSRKRGTIAIASGVYDITGTGFQMDYWVSYSGGWDPQDWTRPKVLPTPKATVDPDTGHVALPPRLQRFLDDPLTSGESIFVRSDGASTVLPIGGNSFPHGKMSGDSETVIDRVAIVGDKTGAQTQPTCLFLAAFSRRLLKDVMTVDRHNHAHCYLGARGWGGNPLRLQGCIAYMPYGGKAGNPRPQVLFTAGREDQDAVHQVRDSCFIGPVGGRYTRIPGMWNYHQDAEFTSCQFVGSANSRIQFNAPNSQTTFTDCEFWLDKFVDLVKHRQVTFRDCQVSCRRGGTPDVQTKNLDFKGTTFSCPKGVEPLPGGVEQYGASVVRRPVPIAKTAPLTPKEYANVSSPLEAIRQTFPKLFEL